MSPGLKFVKTFWTFTNGTQWVEANTKNIEIPASDLKTFNLNIVGSIEVIAEFRGTE